MLTRFLPFLIFKEDRKTPGFVQYIGKYLPSAVFGMLVVYCLKNVDVLEGNHGLPELIAILVTGTAGDGRVAAFATDFAPHWGGDFVRWSGYPQFWAQLLVWLANTG